MVTAQTRSPARTDAFVRGTIRVQGDLVAALKRRTLIPADGAG